MLLLSNYNLSVVPVCDNQNNYKGSISGKNLLNIFSNQSSFTQNGATLIMFLNNTDYQFSEIAQIIESNDSKILAFYNDFIE